MFFGPKKHFNTWMSREGGTLNSLTFCMLLGFLDASHAGDFWLHASATGLSPRPQQPQMFVVGGDRGFDLSNIQWMGQRNPNHQLTTVVNICKHHHHHPMILLWFSSPILLVKQFAGPSTVGMTK